MVILRNEDYNQIFEEHTEVMAQLKELHAYLEVIQKNLDSMKQDINDNSFDVVAAWREGVLTQHDLIVKILSIEDQYMKLCNVTLNADKNSKKIGF